MFWFGCVCLLLAISSSLEIFDGHIQLKGRNNNYEYQLLPFSNLDYPADLSLEFTIIREFNFCDPSSIIGPNSSTAAIINHGPCSIYIQAQNLLSVGYKYAIIAGIDVESLPRATSDNDEYTLNQLTAILPETLNTIVGSNKMDSITLEITFTPYNFSQFICICDKRSQFLVSKNFISNFDTTMYDCISRAIDQMNNQGRTFHTLQEITAGLSLSNILQKNNQFDETRLIVRWLTQTLITNEANYLKIYSQDTDSLNQYALELISTLYSIGEWKLATELLSIQTTAFCNISSSINKLNTNTKIDKSMHDLCSNTCSVVFLTVFGTLHSPIHTKRALQNEYIDDWTVASNENHHHHHHHHHQIKKLKETPTIISPLVHCLHHFHNSLVRGGSGDEKDVDDIDQINSFLINKISLYNSHPALWLSANELIYISKKYGVINTLTFLHQSLLAHPSAETTTLTSHMHDYIQLLSHHQKKKDVANEANGVNCSIFNSEFPKIRFDYLPLASQTILKKNMKLGRNKKKSMEILTDALITHLTRDMTEIHSRLGVFWDEYGAFTTSQRHVLLRISILLCRSYSSQSSSLPAANEMLKLSCLFERPLVATPMIFGSLDEFHKFRNQQISSLTTISSTISTYIKQNTTSLFHDSMEDHLKVISFESQITSTPPSMMIGYQYEIQDMGDKALAPAISLLPSSFDILGNRHQNDILCHSKTSTSISSSLLSPTLQPKEIKSRIKVGFISRFFYEHSVGRLIEGIISQLNSLKFETVVFCICCANQPERNDLVQQHLRSSSQITWIDLQSKQFQTEFHCPSQFLSNPEELESVLSRVKSSQLDILIYPELGMDSLTIHFASKRLSPIQAVFWGHPVSQNLPSIDYFISSSLFHFHNPRCQFPRIGFEKCPIGFVTQEQVVYLDGLTTIFPSPVIDLKLNTNNSPFLMYRSYLPPDRRNDLHVYLLPHTIMKYSTVFIRTLATLLLKDDNGILVILYNTNQYLWYLKLKESIHQQLKKLYCQIKISEQESLTTFPEHDSSSTQLLRYPELPLCYHPSCGMCCNCTDSTTLQSLHQRVIFLPKVPKSEYLFMTKHASVILDPFPFGMGVTAFETFALGLPIVTLPVYQSTPALVLGMIRKMNLTQAYLNILVANSLSEYVENTIKIATIGHFRNQLLDAIKMNSFRLFDDNSAVIDWERFMEGVVRNSM